MRQPGPTVTNIESNRAYHTNPDMGTAWRINMTVGSILKPTHPLMTDGRLGEIVQVIIDKVAKAAKPTRRQIARVWLSISCGKYRKREGAAKTMIKSNESNNIRHRQFNPFDRHHCSEEICAAIN
ncbi:hypothetical protein VFPPC_18673 [Pochonia chlamydosporia 170]|uniref:Uncharacterized protein n=1 Tax=Pochonia chlamydosporia 170 TaxID=1380566 RepID=A0A219AS61_METCM|nr:hypothetical protein VFPPC_18673 [Pochonia chlamydosporia 170]OWT43600.1 hypothetical protein VFPPC_18673 [Pochonia chlamydosporia 170]